MKKISLILMLLSAFLLNCKKDKDDSAKNLLTLSLLQNLTKTTTYDWYYSTLADAIPNSILVAQNKIWVAAQSQSSTGIGSIHSSSDGITWTKTSYSGPELEDIKYLNNQFIAVGGRSSTGGGVIFTSTDGTTWTQTATVASMNTITSIAGNSSYYVITGIGSASNSYFVRAISTNLVNWTSFTTSNIGFSGAGVPRNQAFVTSSGAGYVSNNSGGINICASNCTTSTNWSISTIGASSYFAELNGTIVAISPRGSQPALISYSTNGGAFIQADFSGITSYDGISVIDNKFVISSVTNSTAVNSTINFYYSTDGITWKTTTTPSMTFRTGAERIGNLVYLNGRYVSIHNNSARIGYTTSPSITFP